MRVRIPPWASLGHNDLAQSVGRLSAASPSQIVTKCWSSSGGPGSVEGRELLDTIPQVCFGDDGIAPVNVLCLMTDELHRYGSKNPSPFKPPNGSPTEVVRYLGFSISSENACAATG